MGGQERELLITSPKLTAAPSSDGPLEGRDNVGSTYQTVAGDDEKKESSLWLTTDLRQKLLVLFLMVADFSTLFCSSIPSPFLARMVTKRGGTVLQSAVVLQGIMLAMAFSCILFGKYQPILGCKRLFVLGLILFSLCQVALGFLHFASELLTFVIFGAVLRILQGIAEGAFAVSSLTILCQEFPSHLTTVFGITEAAVGAGYLLGPIFGGALFDASGMLLPMALSGGIVLLCIPLSFILLRSYSADVSSNKFSVAHWISKPVVVLVLGSVAAVFGGVGFCDTAMTGYVEKLGFSVTDAGVVLFSMGLSYCIASVAAGYLADVNRWIKHGVMIFGYLGFALIGLAFTPKQSTAIIYVGTSLLGVFVAFATIPAFDVLVEGDENANASTKLALQSAVSGAWYFAIGIGMFAFSLLGSTLQASLEFFYLSLIITVCSGLLLALLSFCLVLAVKRICKKT